MSRSRTNCRSVAAGLIICSVFAGASARAQSVDAMLNAPGWDLAYEVEFKSSDSGTNTSLHGPISYTRSVSISYSLTLALDMRNMGSSLTMARMVSGSDPSGAEAQQAIIDLSMRAETMANWMSAGVQISDNASDSELMAAAAAFIESSKGPGSVEYLMTEKGDDLVNEVGSKYDMTRTTTARGAGTVLGPTQLMFEIDAQTKTYLLTLSNTFTDRSDSTVQTEIVAVMSDQGKNPDTQRSSRRSSLGSVPGAIRVDDPKSLLGDIPLMQGELDPSNGKITGERVVKGHYEDGAKNVPGTFVFRYTLTPRT